MSAPLTPDETTTRVETVGTSPKAVAAAGASALMGTIAAVLQLAQGSPEVFGLPPVWGILLAVALPPIVSFFAAYSAKPGSVRQITGH